MRQPRRRWPERRLDPAAAPDVLEHRVEVAAGLVVHHEEHVALALEGVVELHDELVLRLGLWVPDVEELPRLLLFFFV